MLTSRLCLLCCAIGVIGAQPHRKQALSKPSNFRSDKIAGTYNCPTFHWDPPGNRMVAARGYNVVCTTKTPDGIVIKASQHAKESENFALKCLPRGLQYECKVFAINVEGSLSLPSKPYTVNVPRGKPCKPDIELASRDGNTVKINWKLDCDGGCHLQNCTLEHSSKRSRYKRIKPCNADGKFSTADDTIRDDTVYAVHVKTNCKDNHRFEGRSDPLAVKFKDPSSSQGTKVAIAFGSIGGGFLAGLIGLVMWKKGCTLCSSRELQTTKVRFHPQISNTSEASIGSIDSSSFVDTVYYE